jgi:hypothetical protein
MVAMTCGARRSPTPAPPPQHRRRLACCVHDGARAGWSPLPSAMPILAGLVCRASLSLSLSLSIILSILFFKRSILDLDLTAGVHGSHTCMYVGAGHPANGGLPRRAAAQPPASPALSQGQPASPASQDVHTERVCAPVLLDCIIVMHHQQQLGARACRTADGTPRP